MLAVPSDTRNAERLEDYLHEHADGAGECRHTQRVIGAALGLTPQEVSRAAARLSARGAVVIDRPGSDTAPTPNRYRLTRA